MGKQYKIRPSEVIGLTNDYEAFCFDEACTYILNEMLKENAREPKFMDNEKINKTNNSDVIEWLNTNNKN
ncbi:hypothetical protein [uncultured Clostridium sp.]|uniref:hypothetical protein n=1 Tax=uncultured Clostridium sp. TaxID=59620 RepID=UPI0028EF9855|nr:hypothetical protein [uncultured Clostridium sp.]